MRDRGVYIRSLIVTVGIVGALSFSRKMIVRADDLHATSLYAIDQTKQRKSRTVIGIVLLATLLAEL